MNRWEKYKKLVQSVDNISTNDDSYKDAVIEACYYMLKEFKDIYFIDSGEHSQAVYVCKDFSVRIGNPRRLYLDENEVVMIEFLDGESVYLGDVYVEDVNMVWESVSSFLEDEDYDEDVEWFKEPENGYPKHIAPTIEQIKNLEYFKNEATTRYRDKVIGLFHDVLKRDKELLMPNPEQRCKVCYSGADADGESGRVKRIYLNEENKVAVELTDGGHILFSDIYESDYRYIYELMFGFLK